MKNTKLIDFISALDAEELERLQQFVSTAYYNPAQRAQQLFALLYKVYPTFSEVAIADKKIFAALFGTKKTFSDALLRNVISDLYALCEQFAIAETIRQKSSERYQLLVQYLLDKKLFAQAEAALHQWQIELEKLPKDETYFQGTFRWLHASFSIAFHRHYKGNLHKLYKKKDPAELFTRLQNYYLFEFSALSGEVVNSFKQHNQQFDKEALLQTISYFLQRQKELHPVVLLRLQLNQLLFTEDETLYVPVKKYFLKVHVQAHPADVQNMLVTLHGFAAARAWQGSAFFKNELEELNLLRLKLNLLLDESNEINPVAFWNFADMLLRKKGKKTTDDFVKKYAPHLPPATRAELLQLVNASALMHEKKYAPALQQLLTVGKPFFASEIVYRRMLLSCYYELQQWDMLQTTLETTDKFLRNNAAQLPVQITTAFKNYTEALRLLFRSNMQPRPNLPKLKAHLRKHPGMYDAEWIGRKAALLG